MILTIVARYWRYAICAVFVAVIYYCFFQYGRAKYELGKIHGIASMQTKLNAANTTIAAMERASVELAAKHAEQMAQASKNYQMAKSAREKKERAQYGEVQKIVEKPVYHTDCIDYDGLSELIRAIKIN